jgi:Meiotically up-regulated gene 113
MPVSGEVRLKRKNDPSFPSHNVFSRFGSKSQLISKIVEYCSSHTGFDDIIQLCSAMPSSEDSISEEKPKGGDVGTVYLIKAGRYYKIGKTNAIGRREYELAIQLPTKARTVHVIRTDDPSGIEIYWHTRFAAKRTNGEWFGLDASDVSAFRRRKFM